MLTLAAAVLVRLDGRRSYGDRTFFRSSSTVIGVKTFLLRLDDEPSTLPPFQRPSSSPRY